MPLPTQAQRDRLALAGGANFTALPDADAPLSWPTSAVLITSDGNMGLVLAGGTDNDSDLVAVTAGQFFPLQAIALSPSNTAGAIGIDGIASDDGLSISGSPTLVADQGSPYSGFTPTISGGSPPYYAYLGSGSLPGGMAIEPTTGALHGTPTASGSFAGIIIRVRDNAGFVASLAPFTLVVANALTISGTPVTTGNQNVAYDGFTVAGAGGTPPYTYEVTAGSLPTGITLDASTGVVSGTPTNVETKNNIVIIVTDDAGGIAGLPQFDIVISA